MRARRIVLALAAIGAVFALTGVRQEAGRFHTAFDAVQAQTPPADAFQCVWSQPIPDLRAAALTPDGDAVATISGDGRVRLWDWGTRPNTPLWTHRVPGASAVAVSTGGHSVLAYALLDPTRPGLSFLGTGGRQISRSTLDGAIWDVSISPDGRYAAASTGEQSLYLYTLNPHPALHRWRLDGIGKSLAFTPDGSALAAGTWDDSGVTCYTPRGATVWHYPLTPSGQQAPINRLFETQVARRGQCLMALSYANRREGDGTLYFWQGQARGRPAWSHPLGEDAYYPRAMVSQDGSNVAVTYTRFIRHGEQSVPEHRLLVLDEGGNILWEKGGLLFSPTLVSVAADGHRVTVSDGQNTLYHLNAEGRITAPYRFNSTIRQTVTSPDGRWLLVYTGDGRLNLMKLG